MSFVQPVGHWKLFYKCEEEGMPMVVWSVLGCQKIEDLIQLVSFMVLPAATLGIAFSQFCLLLYMQLKNITIYLDGNFKQY